MENTVGANALLAVDPRDREASVVPLVGVHAGVDCEHVVVPPRLGHGRLSGDDAPHPRDRADVHLAGRAEVPFDEIQAGPAPKRPLAREVVLVPVADELCLELFPARPHEACVDKLDRAVPGLDRSADRELGEGVGPRCRVVVSAGRGPSLVAVRHPPAPSVVADGVPPWGTRRCLLDAKGHHEQERNAQGNAPAPGFGG